MMRVALASALACVFALRLLTPAGFMPAFERGAVTIVVCPEVVESPAPMAGHHHHQGGPKKLHQLCPYAAVSSLGLALADLSLPAAFLAIGLALLLGRTFLFVERSRKRERPPLRGPPLPA